MGMFSSLFGSSGSDKADKMRQKAIDAFNAIQTPELKDLQVQLDKYVSQGILTPEQAESQLLNSNAFNDIKTDPSLIGAQKQALTQLQDVAKQGGLTATDKSRMQDITDEQNATAKGRNEAILSDAKARGVGGSGVESVNRLINEQSAADRASRQGTDVAAQAEQRALQAMQAAGGLGGQIEAQQYGEQANKAQAQNAIDLFNANTRNATNLYNTSTANQTQAANLASKQGIANANTDVSNTNKEYNADAVQKQYQDTLAKANGVAGTFNNWANDATAARNKEQGAEAGMVGGLINAGATAGATAIAGPAGGAAVQGATSQSPQFGKVYSPTQKEMGYAEGGMVEDEPSLDDAYGSFVKKYCYGGKINMADGGAVHIKPGKTNKNKPTGQLPISPAEGNEGFSLKDPKGQPVGDFKSYIDAAQFADKVKEKQPHEEDFRAGGKVPGVAPVQGDSPKNDLVPAKLSPGEVVLPRSVVAKPEEIPGFVNHSLHEEDPMVTALRRLRNPQVGSERG